MTKISDLPTGTPTLESTIVMNVDGVTSTGTVGEVIDLVDVTGSVNGYAPFAPSTPPVITAISAFPDLNAVNLNGVYILKALVSVTTIRGGVTIEITPSNVGFDFNFARYTRVYNPISEEPPIPRTVYSLIGAPVEILPTNDVDAGNIAGMIEIEGLLDGSNGNINILIGPVTADEGDYLYIEGVYVTLTRCSVIEAPTP